MILTPDDDAGTVASPRHRNWISWTRAPSLVTSLIDIDVAMTDIVFQPYVDGLDSEGPKAIVNYAIEGVVVSAGVDDEGAGASVSSVVYVSGYEEADRMDRSEDFDRRSVCYIDSDRRPEDARRTNIYIERFIFRHLVELYASRRIDSARISISLKVLRDPSGAIEVPILSHPVLRTAGDCLRQHSRAHLVSVQTSLRGGPLIDPAVLPRSSPWGARMGRRQLVVVSAR